MQRQTNKKHSITFDASGSLNDKDAYMLFLLLTQHSHINLFHRTVPYEVTANDLTTEISISHRITKKIRDNKPHKTIQSNEHRHEIIDRKLGSGGTGFFCSAMGTIKLDQHTQRALIKPKQTRGVKFTQGLDRMNEPIFIEYNRGQIPLVPHAYKMMMLNQDLYKPKIPLYDPASKYFLLPMKRFDGEDFFNYLASYALFTPQMGLEQALIICQNVLKMLKRLHDNHFIHRDLKPENMLINPNTLEIWIIDPDYGLDDRVSSVGADYVGTPHYIAPEAWGHTEASAASDIFAFGKIMMLILGNPDEVMQFYCTDSNSQLTIKDMTLYGVIIDYQTLLSRTPYRTSDATKQLIYHFIHSTQAVIPANRPTVQACLDQLDAIYASDQQHQQHVAARATANTINRSNIPNHSPRLLFTPSSTATTPVAGAAATVAPTLTRK